MKYTNIKKLLIKFMGGGLINFPTRFLRWIKIDGDSDGSDGGGDDSGGGDSTPTEVYIKFKAENFGIRDADYVPDTVDRSKGYSLDEIFDTSGSVLEGFIKCQEDARDALVSSGYDLQVLAYYFDCYNYYNGNPEDGPSFNSLGYFSSESGNIGSQSGSYPKINTAFIKYDDGYTAKTFIKVEGTNLNGYSWTPPMIVFGKNDEDGLWYIVYAR